MRRIPYSPFTPPLGADRAQNGRNYFKDGLILHWGNRISEGVWYCTGYGTGVSLGARNGVVHSSVPIATGKFGAALSFSATSSQFVDVSTPDLGASSGPILQNLSQFWTICQWFRVDSIAGACGLFSETSSGSITLGSSVTTGGKAEISINTSGIWRTITGASTMVAGDGKWHCLIITQSPSAGVSLYLDGVLDAVDAGATGSSVGGTGAYIGAHRHAGTNTSVFNGLISYTSVWSRALEVSEIASLSRNPHQIFGMRPVPTALSGAPTPMSDLTLSATLDNFILSSLGAVRANATFNQPLANMLLTGSFEADTNRELYFDQLLATIQVSAQVTSTPPRVLGLSALLSDLLFTGQMSAPPGATLTGNFFLDLLLESLAHPFRKTRLASGAGHRRVVSAPSSRRHIRAFSLPGAGRGMLVAIGRQLTACADITVYNIAFDVLLTCDNGNTIFTHVLAREFSFADLTQEEVNEFARQVIEAEGLATELDCSEAVMEVVSGNEVYAAKPFTELWVGGTWYFDFSPHDNRWTFRTQ